MHQAAEHAGFLPQILIFLAAAVVGVPLVRLGGLSAVLGYLAAGVAIGPSGFNLFSEPQTLTGIAELGIVMFLFVIGLELKVSRLMEMRRDILLLGTLQMLTSGVLIFAVVRLFSGLTALGIIAAVSLALSATAIALQMLQERGALQSPAGQRIFAILLFQDISVVPVLGILPLFAPGANHQATSSGQIAADVASGFAAIAVIILLGRYVLNMLFGLLARFEAREVMTAAALLVVLGSALLMSAVGMSMALGAFLAGLLLAESNFRHELEADIEPFRGLLLGLFFMAVGMGIDLHFVLANAGLIIGGAFGLILLKLTAISGLLRLFGLPPRDAIRFGSLLTPAGEFAFVLLPLASGVLLIGQEQAGLFTAIAALSMVLGPIAAKLIDVWLRRLESRDAGQTIEEDYSGAGGRVLLVGFGRFGQIVAQMLLSADVEATIIDVDVEQIRSAARFGYKVYYGDGSRLDVLRAARADSAGIICICINDRPASLAIVEMIQANFPQAKIYIRAFDRVHALDLMGQNVDHVTRETFHSALMFGSATLRALGFAAEDADSVMQDVKRRDNQRLEQQRGAGMFGGVDLIKGVKVQPEPLATPKRKTQALTPETETLITPAKGAPPTPGRQPEQADR